MFMPKKSVVDLPPDAVSSRTLPRRTSRGAAYGRRGGLDVGDASTGFIEAPTIETKANYKVRG